MQNQITRALRAVRLPFVLALLGTGFCGCNFVRQHMFWKPKPPPPQVAQAMLTAAEANQITLFGDLRGGGESRYFTRTAVSLRQHTFTGVGSDLDVDIEPSGRRMVVSSTRHNTQPDLYIKNIEGVAVTQLTADPGADVQPAFSPDGSLVAFASNRTGNWDIWIIGVEGGPPIQVTSSPADEIHPSWSPDGTQIVFSSLPVGGGQWELWITHAGAGFSSRFIGYGLFPDWSPVADIILFQRARQQGGHWFSIWTLTLVDGEPRYPTEIAASADYAMILPTWSPDGTRVSYATTDSITNNSGSTSGTEGPGIFDLWLIQADGRSKVRLTDGHTANYAPAFGADGRIFFTSNRRGHDNIWSLHPFVAALGLPGGTAVTGGPGKAPVLKAKTAAVWDDN